MKVYKFPRTPVACRRCERPFEAEQELVSLIVRAPRERAPEGKPVEEQDDEDVVPFERRDYCIGCAGDGETDEFSRWRTTMPTPRADNRPQRIDLSVVFEFFTRLAERDDAADAGYIYFLALYLLRKRQLKFLDSTRETSADGEQEFEVWHLESRPEGRPFRVRDPQIDPEALERVRVHVMDALSAGEMEL